MKATLIGTAVLFAGLFSAQAAHAGTIACSGSHFGYQFSMAAKTRGSQAVGAVTVDVAKNGRLVKRANLQATSSNIVPKQTLQLAAQGADGSGNLQASYNGSDYRGTLVAATQYGTFNVNVSCTLTGASLRSADFMSYDDFDFAE